MQNLWLKLKFLIENLQYNNNNTNTSVRTLNINIYIIKDN